MDLPAVLVWIVVISCLVYLVRGGWSDRENMRGWFWVSAALLLLTLSGWFSGRRGLLIAGEAAWGALILLPSLLSVAYMRCHTAQRFGAARRVAGLLRLLHPGDGWWEIPQLMRALELAQAGRDQEALAIFRRHQDVSSANG